MSRARYTRPLETETLSNIDVWLDDPEITELRREELLAARDRIAAIQTAIIINGMAKEGSDGNGDKEVVDAKRKRSKRSEVR